MFFGHLLLGSRPVRSGEDGRAFFYADEAARGFASLAPYAEKEAVRAEQIATSLSTRKPSGEGA
jgi:hypothetical protein